MKTKNSITVDTCTTAMSLHLMSHSDADTHGGGSYSVVETKWSGPDRLHMKMHVQKFYIQNTLLYE